MPDITGQVDGMDDWADWDEYVASWPPWRDIRGCTGACPRAWVCGRARVCVQAYPHLRALVYALARLSARTGERPPTRAW
jgi:hypothetical protein